MGIKFFKSRVSVNSIFEFISTHKAINFFAVIVCCFANFKIAKICLYARVSTIEQETANQLLEIKSVGYNIEAHRYVVERI